MLTVSPPFFFGHLFQTSSGLPWPRPDHEGSGVSVSSLRGRRGGQHDARQASETGVLQAGRMLSRTFCCKTSPLLSHFRSTMCINIFPALPHELGGKNSPCQCRIARLPVVAEENRKRGRWKKEENSAQGDVTSNDKPSLVPPPLFDHQ